MFEDRERRDHQEQVRIHHVYRIYLWKIQSVFPHLDIVTHNVDIARHQQDAYSVLGLDNGVKSTPVLMNCNRDKRKD